MATKEQLPGSRPRRTRLPSGRRSLPGSDKNRRRWTLDLRMGEQKNMVSIVKYTMYMGNAMESIFEYIYINGKYVGYIYIYIYIYMWEIYGKLYIF